MKKFNRTIRNENDANQLILWIQNNNTYPYTANLEKGEPKRSLQQNRLAFQWCMDAEGQGDQTAPEYRAYCKLHFGVPILRAESEKFREQYDRIVRPLPYEQKLALMLEPIDFPVTRLMTVKQKTRYLDAIYQHFRGLGFELTHPDLMGMTGWREVA